MMCTLPVTMRASALIRLSVPARGRDLPLDHAHGPLEGHLLHQAGVDLLEAVVPHRRRPRQLQMGSAVVSVCRGSVVTGQGDASRMMCTYIRSVFDGPRLE